MKEKCLALEKRLLSKLRPERSAGQQERVVVPKKRMQRNLEIDSRSRRAVCTSGRFDKEKSKVFSEIEIIMRMRTYIFAHYTVGIGPTFSTCRTRVIQKAQAD